MLEKFKRELAAFRQPMHKETWQQFQQRQQREGSALAIIAWAAILAGGCLLLIAEILDRSL